MHLKRRLLRLCICLFVAGHSVIAEADKRDDKFCNIHLKDVILTRNVRNLGLHRGLVSTIEITFEDNTSCSTCWLMLVEAISNGIYIDLDQIRASETYSGPKVLCSEGIDVEQPAYLSPEHTILVYHPHPLRMTAPKHYSVNVEIPIHIRYHRPAQDPDVTSAWVQLQHPNIMIRCQGSSSGNEMEKVDLYQAPCDSLNTSMCAWQDVKYGMVNGKQLEVPVGHQDHTLIISIVTIMATISGVIVLLWGMHKPQKNKTT